VPLATKKGFMSEGEPFVWMTAGALTFTLLTTFTLLVVVLYFGLGALWPRNLALVTLEDSSMALGEVMQRGERPDDAGPRIQLKVGNRDLYGLDFRWVNEEDIQEMAWPEEAIVLERMEYGNFHGFLDRLELANIEPRGGALHDQFKDARLQARARYQEVDALARAMATLNNRIERIRLQRLRIEYRARGGYEERLAVLDAERAELRGRFEALLQEQTALSAAIRQEQVVLVDANGREQRMALVDIVRHYRPNQKGAGEKLAIYGSKLWELVSAEPRESNTEGGLLPAIFGTVMLIFIMSIFSFPLGVVAGVYLREYAKEGLMVRVVRIAVNNLAGIPSIVYGIFGLGFFVYGIGGGIDAIFFPERLPTPTFGTGGILWASLTLGLLTVPVVIVATEEALGSVPKGVREGSLALGATRFQTLVRTVIPMASPGIMTGFILSMARAAGEVAPLMITGVVKLAPALPLDGQFPYLHLDRKFMHLGFHIYDIGFQSPNVEAAKPMVFVTTMMLVLIVLVMSSVAIYLRNRMRRRFTVSGL